MTIDQRVYRIPFFCLLRPNLRNGCYDGPSIIYPAGTKIQKGAKMHYTLAPRGVHQMACAAAKTKTKERGSPLLILAPEMGCCGVRSHNNVDSLGRRGRGVHEMDLNTSKGLSSPRGGRLRTPRRRLIVILRPGSVLWLQWSLGDLTGFCRTDHLVSHHRGTPIRGHKWCTEVGFRAQKISLTVNRGMTERSSRMLCIAPRFPFTLHYVGVLRIVFANIRMCCTVVAVILRYFMCHLETAFWP